MRPSKVIYDRAPSAMHLKGVEAEKYVREAAQTLAKILKVNEKE